MKKDEKDQKITFRYQTDVFVFTHGRMSMVCVSWEAQHAKVKILYKIKVGFVYSKRLKKSMKWIQ